MLTRAIAVLITVASLHSINRAAVASEDAEASIFATIQQCDEIVAAVPEGEMDFVITSRFSVSDDGGNSAKMKYSGRVAWKFPSIRWDFMQESLSTQGSSPLKRIMLDSPAEVVAYYITSQQVYRSPDRSKEYDKIFRIAPWQTWLEFDGQIPIRKLLSDVVEKPGSRSTQVSARFGSRNIAIITADSGSSLTFSFNEADGTLTGYRTVAKPGKTTFNAQLKWTTVDGVRFPTDIAYFAFKADDADKSPMVTMKFSDHRVGTSFTDVDFTFGSLDLSHAETITTYRKNQKPAKVQLKRKANAPEEKELRDLGNLLKEKGFATDPK